MLNFVVPTLQAEETAKGPSAPEDFEAMFDLAKDKHKGQFALRKLYHESDRLIAGM